MQWVYVIGFSRFPVIVLYFSGSEGVTVSGMHYSWRVQVQYSGIRLSSDLTWREHKKRCISNVLKALHLVHFLVCRMQINNLGHIKVLLSSRVVSQLYRAELVTQTFQEISPSLRAFYRRVMGLYPPMLPIKRPARFPPPTEPSLMMWSSCGADWVFRK